MEKLPNEILDLIAQNINSDKYFCSFSGVNKRIRSVCNITLDKRKWKLYNELKELQLKRKFTRKMFFLEYLRFMGYYNMLFWSIENTNDPIVQPEISWLITQGKLKLLKYIHENRFKIEVENGIDYAAQNGHLNTIKWLYENTNCTYSSTAIDEAAYNGYLDVIKWLHENLNLYGSKLAIINAAKKDYSEIVKWLYENQTNRIADAMFFAPKNGRVDKYFISITKNASINKHYN